MSLIFLRRAPTTYIAMESRRQQTYKCSSPRDTRVTYTLHCLNNTNQKSSYSVLSKSRLSSGKNASIKGTWQRDGPFILLYKSAPHRSIILHEVKRWFDFVLDSRRSFFSKLTDCGDMATKLNKFFVFL
jgi:hypothetical protein